MDEFVRKAEYDERMKRIDDEDRRQNRRIDKLETITDQIADMAASIKALIRKRNNQHGATSVAPFYLRDKANG